ncbi:MAG: PAS domain S-box protein [Chitinispirillaceae bacterium]|nr:PAS domain S-box protein [Chitinispirillaceae bacterium]
MAISKGFTSDDPIMRLSLANEKLQESEQRFRALIENSADAISLLDAEGRILYESPSYYRIMGYSAESRIGQNTFELVHPEDRQHLQNLFAGLLESPEPVIISPARVRHSDGSWRWIEGVANNMLKVPAVGAVVINFRDITDRKQAELALKESETRLRLLSDNLFCGMVYQIDAGIYGERRRFTYVSAGVQRLHGITAEQALGDADAVYGQVVEEDRLLLVLRETAAVAKMVPFDAEVRIRLPSGAVRWSYFTSCPRRLSDNHLVWDGIELDITDRRKNQEELKKSHIIHTMITENAADVLWTYSIVEDRFIFVSDSVFALRGYTPEEVLTRSMKDNLTPESFEHVNKLFAGKMASRKKGDTSPIVMKAEAMEPCKDGREIAVEIVATYIFDTEGRPVEVLGITRDITEKKKLLESAQRADKLEAVGMLAGGIAHDFNNLLGGIYGYMDMALGASKEPEVKEYLEKTLSTMNRARGLTQQLLTFAKGGAPIRKIDRLVPFLQETALFAISGSNVSCSFDVPSDLWPCNFDRNQIGQVIDNLVINAQQAMPLGGAIVISAANVLLREKEHPLLAGGRYVGISVKDRGIGIPKENLSRIFDPFFTTKTKGHGLGLATCYSIVKRHEGCLDVESELGQGSTFHVFLPASTDTVVSAAAATVFRHKGEGTIVIMDDEQVIRDTVSVMLKSFGYSVVAVENGNEAIHFLKMEAAAQRKIVAMFFDLTIAGGMGGKETIGEIRKIDQAIPVFVASGYADDQVMAHPADYGFTASICKPFTVSELAKVLNDHFDGSK